MNLHRDDPQTVIMAVPGGFGRSQATWVLHEALSIVEVDESTLRDRRPVWAIGRSRLLSQLPAQSRDRARVLVQKSLFPCTVILFAGTLLADGRVSVGRASDSSDGVGLYRDRLIKLVESSYAGDPVYRVNDNLACLHASLARFDPSNERADDLAESYRRLASAIAGARPERRAELRKWAWNDPSLSELVEDRTMRSRLESLLGPREADASRSFGERL